MPWKWFDAKPVHIGPGIPPDPHLEASWFKRRWVAFDQLLNVWFLNGLPDETISSHAGRLLETDDEVWWSKFVCWLCNKFDTNHCKESIGH